MRRILIVAAAVAGCTPGVVERRSDHDPRVFAGTPRCGYEVLGSFSRSPELLREIESRGGHAAINVVQDERSSPDYAGDPGTAPRFFSGQVVRFTDPGCRT